MSRPISTASIGRICNTINTNVASSTTTATTASMENCSLTNKDSQSTVVGDEKFPMVDLDTLSKNSVSKQPLEDRLPDDMDIVMVTPTSQPLQVRLIVLTSHSQELETKIKIHILINYIRCRQYENGLYYLL